MIYALGIPHVGSSASKAIAAHFRSWRAFRETMSNAGRGFDYLSDVAAIDRFASEMTIAERAATATVHSLSSKAEWRDISLT